VVNLQLQFNFLLLRHQNGEKKNKESRNAAGLLKKVNKPILKRKEEQRQLHSQKIAKYQIKKAEEKQAKDTMARQAALEKMGIQVTQQECGFEDHKGIYNYAQERAPSHHAPIKMIDASNEPPDVTSYPDYPRAEFSPPLAFNIAGAICKVALKSKEETVLVATASRDFARLCRAKTIFLSSTLNRTCFLCRLNRGVYLLHASCHFTNKCEMCWWSVNCAVVGSKCRSKAFMQSRPNPRFHAAWLAKHIIQEICSTLLCAHRARGS
jgi:hypothetical protein